jgi:S1-C subfamily serine protease
MNRKTLNAWIHILILILVVLLAAWGGWAFYHQHTENAALAARLSGLESEVKILTTSLQQANLLDQQSAAQVQELANRQSVETPSESQLLTAAVAKVAPSVVSIVISKDVPQLTVTYENPFGNDPFFQGFGIQVPVYQQTGTTTQEVGAGTGFFIRSDGYIITNRHVASDLSAQYTVLLPNGTQKNGTVVYQDPNNDIAIMKVGGSGYTPATFGDSSQLELGQTVAAIGNALGQYNNSVSVGVISGINRTIQAQDDNGNVEQLSGILQTDAAINPGNSGGPLLDLSGDVVGINVATAVGSQSIGFSIPVNEIKKIIAQEVP